MTKEQLKEETERVRSAIDLSDKISNYEIILGIIKNDSSWEIKSSGFISTNVTNRISMSKDTVAKIKKLLTREFKLELKKSKEEFENI